MAAWLIPIVGVVVIGVIIELVSKNSSIGRFVRAIYSFFVLFVIIEPIPKLFTNTYWEGEILVNADLLTEINKGTATAKQEWVEAILRNLGFSDFIVFVDGDEIYITTNGNLTADDEIEIKQIIGEENVHIL
jgi:hypothetical protein